LRYFIVFGRRQYPDGAYAASQNLWRCWWNMRYPW
jgi:hypothetical protein